ncbi:unnamed protein product [Urochloa humidicola]
MTDTGKRHVLRASPEVVLKISKKYAIGALEHYNKRKKFKFELVDVKPVNNMLDEGDCYAHVNFTARSSKEGSEEQQFFAELQLCSRRQAASGLLVTCCEPLGPDHTVGHRGLPLDCSVVRNNVDIRRCFACSSRMLHPNSQGSLVSNPRHSKNSRT